MIKLLEFINIKNQAINQIENNQKLFHPVYKLARTNNFKNLHQNLVYRFIQFSILKIKNPIFFFLKKDKSL